MIWVADTPFLFFWSKKWGKTVFQDNGLKYPNA
jgi:hypothetical protein